MGTETVSEKKIERVPTYVRGLDERLEGGLPKGYVVLISGSAGTMKSSFAFNLIYNAAKEKKSKGAYITLEQGEKNLLKHMAKLGMDISTSKDIKERVSVVDLSQLRKDLGKQMSGDWIEPLIAQIKKYKERLGFELLILDSLQALYVLSNMQNPRNELFFFFEQLRDLGLTSLLISEMSREGETFGTYGIEDFLADGVIHLNLEREGRNVDRYLSVIKMRATKHDTNYFPLLVENGFEIVTR
jgi:KaiC/GvpD/RAD55 family RecA-like ATPase